MRPRPAAAKNCLVVSPVCLGRGDGLPRHLRRSSLSTSIIDARTAPSSQLLNCRVGGCSLLHRFEPSSCSSPAANRSRCPASISTAGGTGARRAEDEHQGGSSSPGSLVGRAIVGTFERSRSRSLAESIAGPSWRQRPFRPPESSCHGCRYSALHERRVLGDRGRAEQRHHEDDSIQLCLISLTKRAACSDVARARSGRGCSTLVEVEDGSPLLPQRGAPARSPAARTARPSGAGPAWGPGVPLGRSCHWRSGEALTAMNVSGSCNLARTLQADAGRRSRSVPACGCATSRHQLQVPVDALVRVDALLAHAVHRLQAPPQSTQSDWEPAVDLEVPRPRNSMSPSGRRRAIAGLQNPAGRNDSIHEALAGELGRFEVATADLRPADVKLSGGPYGQGHHVVVEDVESCVFATGLPIGTKESGLPGRRSSGHIHGSLGRPVQVCRDGRCAGETSPAAPWKASPLQTTRTRLAQATAASPGTAAASTTRSDGGDRLHVVCARRTHYRGRTSLCHHQLHRRVASRNSHRNVEAEGRLRRTWRWSAKYSCIQDAG